MKTTLRDLSESYASAIADQTTLAGKPIVPEDICHAFCDGFKACESKMMTDIVRDAKSYADKEANKNPDVAWDMNDIEKAFEVGAMSQAKMDAKLRKRLKHGLMAIQDYLVLHVNRQRGSDQQYLQAIQDKCNELTEALKQGGEK